MPDEIPPPETKEPVLEALDADKPSPDPRAQDAQPDTSDSSAVPIAPIIIPGPNASRWQRLRYWLYKYGGTLLMVRTNHGDVVMSLERTSYVLLLVLAAGAWARGQEIPESMGRFLDILVGAVFGQGVLSTVALYIKSKHGANK